ncbi:DUF418 domain-containing protein [Sphingomonas sp.]|uniref:DUF418 domain-containing protein n=1 Tax=Sphingomonas sp. TaxID=28214 RepID=UPI003B3B2255
MTDRVIAIDAVRGFAVCGILVMNVVAMGLPLGAYVDPNVAGGARGADLAAWALAYVLADGKMRALFSMLFGASLLIVTDAAEGRTPGPARTHYARMGWLFAFGMLHAWLVWYGDILVEYALCGAILFVARRWPPAALGYAALLLLGWEVARNLIQWGDLAALHILATGPGAPPDAVRAWGDILDWARSGGGTAAGELRLYRGGFADVFAIRASMTAMIQFRFMPFWLPATLGFMALGMLLYRVGFWTIGWSVRAYWIAVVAGLCALALHVPLAQLQIARGFDPVTRPLAEALGMVLRPFAALGYAAALILLVRARGGGALVERLAAAGRMAFSNYLGTSLIVTTLFYGYGLGLFGQVSRAQLYWIVAGQWCLILGWSKPWLARFRYGPLEWLWRSLARGRLQPIRIGPPASRPQ